MHSAAYILLERDFQELKRNNYVGISAFPVSDNMLKWEAEIEGLKDSMWEGLIYQLELKFPSEYNHKPPAVRFKTIPFHPNDSNTGRPSIDFLDDLASWDSSYRLSSILLALQVMLSNPMLENPVNLEATRILYRNENMYRKIIHKLFQEPVQEEDENQELPAKPNKLSFGNIPVVTFQDYYKMWSEIATSKATEHHRNTLLEDPNFLGKYYKWKKMDLHCPKEWKLKFATTKYRLARENSMPQEVSYRVERLSVCPTPNTSTSELESSSGITSETVDQKSDRRKRGNQDQAWDSPQERWEEEVQDLVDWSASLDEGSLE
ncbi:ubiquitin-conjugating enzyme E2 U isoform 2-T2 [Thomomys bottae]